MLSQSTDRTRALARLVWSLLGLWAPALSLAEQPANETQPSPKLEEVLVTGSRQSDFTVITEDTQKLVEMPGALGDPMGAVYSLPGVVYGNDGGNPAVRGSSPADNRYFVDFLPSGYVFHDFTNSVFSEFILHDFQMYSAGFGPEYPGVTGAVFDIALREPANQPLSAIVDLSMLRSGVFVESGLGDSRAFYLSARQSLIHLFIPEGEEEDGIVIEQAPQDNDYQFKLQQATGDQSHLSVSLSGASDRAAAQFTRESEFVRSNPDFEGDAELTDGYHAQGLVWDWLGDGGYQFKIGLGHYQQNYDVDWGNDYFFEAASEQLTVRTEWVAPLNGQHTLTVGAIQEAVDHRLAYEQILFICTEFDPDCSQNRRERIADDIDLDLVEQAAYINERWSPSAALALDLGAQWYYSDYTEETFVHPRVALRYEFRENWTATAKAGDYNRLPEMEYITPQLGNPALRSPTARHYSLGLEHEWADAWSWSLELYYKALDDLPLGLPEDAPDADKLYSNDVEGRAYGFDLFINKNLTDRWYGWFALSFAKSQRTNLRTEQTRDYQLDTPLIANWVVNYQMNPRFNLGGRWTLRSGAPYTPIVDVKENPYFDDAVFPEYGEPYSERLPLYSQLDLRFKWDLTLFGRLKSAVILDIINALNQKNVTDRGLDYDAVDSPDDEVATEDTKTPGIIPAATLRLYF